MTKKLSIIVILAIALFALLQCNSFAAGPIVYDGTNQTDELDLTTVGNMRVSGCEGVIKAAGAANLIITGDATVHGVMCSEENGGDNCHSAMAIFAKDNAIVTISGGTYTNDPDPDMPNHSDLIYVRDNAQINITGGTFKCATPSWTLNGKDEHKGLIKVTGGKFFEFNPATANTKAGDNGQGIAPAGKVEVVVPDGYEVVASKEADGMWYTVVEKVPTLAYSEGTHTVKLSEVGDLKASGCEGVIKASGTANVTITENSNIHGNMCVNGDDCHSAMAIFAKDKAIVTISGGTYTNDPDPDMPNHSDLIYVRDDAQINITGGTFKCATPSWTLNGKDSHNGLIKVTGGRFFKFNPATANTTEGDNGQGIAPAGKVEVVVPEGYSVVKDGDWYWVCGHEGSLTKTDAKAATYTTDGNIEYYTCSKCNKLFEDEKATKETNSIKVVIPMLIQVNNSGNASVDNVVVDDAITESGNSSVVELPAIENATSVTVPVASVNEVVAADKGLTVETKDTTVTLDAKAVEEVAKQAGTATNITIEVTKTEEKTLNKEQKEAIKDKEVAIVLSAKILADGKEISNFNGGKVKVEIPFTPAEGTKGSDYKVYYVADDGKVTAIPTRYVKGNLVVELEHFSEYVVVKEVATAAPAPSAPAASANPNEKDNTPKTGAASVIGLVVAMSVIGLAVLRKRD